MTRFRRCRSRGELLEFEQLEAERFDLCNEAEQGGLIVKQTG
jgi:hypothetical protein